ncbi:glutamate synthase [Bifidobacterium dolichotidis]|uniref:ferredoxin--NADP(+) reductase n=1 Tax=Bifidobacterium dolichotidis TaxID=2306976 RepID=A0A430FQX5_9BIFI|nr:glutamate synthase [Bifidobacterium dolichotidis]
MGSLLSGKSGTIFGVTATNTESENNGLRIAVIGAGPAGVYSSDIFLRQLKKLGDELGLGTEARIDLFERLPVPFGLVRYGVAPDHPSIKFIASALEKTLDNPHIHLYCDVEFGKDVTLEDLLERYDAVLFATGAVKDKPLRLPGADLDGVYGAAEFVGWYDGHPAGKREWPLDAERVAVIGGGNVAMDVARELMRNADDLKAKTDIPDNVYEGIKANKAKELHLFIRRGVAQAKFSVQELREMEKLPGVQLIINEDDFELDDDTIEMAQQDKLTRQMVEELYAIREMAEDMEDDGDVDFEGNPADRKYYIHFNSAPTEILGEDGHVKAIRVEHTETSADGVMKRLGSFTDYPVEAVYHAIGYKPESVTGIAYDEHGAHLANANGDGRITVEADNGEVRDRLYATGWAKRGPVGLIGSTKSDALLIVTNMLEDLAKDAEGGRVAADRDPESIDRLLAERGVHPIDFAGWKRIDAYERAEGAKEGREHKKVIDPEQFRALAHEVAGE